MKNEKKTYSLFTLRIKKNGKKGEEREREREGSIMKMRACLKRMMGGKYVPLVLGEPGVWRPDTVRVLGR